LPASSPHFTEAAEEGTLIQAITASELFTAAERVEAPLVLVEDGRILTIDSRTARAIPAGAKHLDFSDAVLVPGLVDLHIHGAAGYDVMEASDAGLWRMSSFLARHGVSAFLATTVTAEADVLAAAAEKIAEQILSWQERGGARPVGIHLEGPCINRHRRGAHPLAAIQNPSIELFDHLHRAAGGTLRMITLAPELPGAHELIREAVQRGVKVSIGHTDGSAEDARAAIAAGATHVTHIFNAMRPMLHRAPGVAGEGMVNPGLSAEIIADGVHVDPVVVDLFLRARGGERAVLVTDAISATGMGEGVYTLGTFQATVRGARAEYEGHLAGSVLTLDAAVRNVMAFAGWPLAESVRLATANAAAVLGDEALGTLRAGGRADLTVLSRKGEPVESFVAGIRMGDGSREKASA
jgi:N-acetylglucosamine-6-phosphate deacetylase